MGSKHELYDHHFRRNIKGTVEQIWFRTDRTGKLGLVSDQSVFTVRVQ